MTFGSFSSSFIGGSNFDRALLLVRLLSEEYGCDFKLIRDGRDFIKSVQGNPQIFSLWEELNHDSLFG